MRRNETRRGMKDVSERLVFRSGYLFGLFNCSSSFACGEVGNVSIGPYWG